MNRTMIFAAIYMILIGLMLAVKAAFRLDFNGYSAATALLLLESGVFLLIFGGRKTALRRGGGKFLFMHGRVLPSQQDTNVTVCFSDADIELPSVLPPEMEVRCFFSNCVVRLPQGRSVRAQCSVSFGDMQTPEGALSGFGEKVLIVGDGPQSLLRLRCCFGSLTLYD